MSHSGFGWTLGEWQQAYRNAQLQPGVLAELLAELSSSDPAWISLATPTQLQAQLEQLAERLATASGDLSKLPLYGVPFAIKDNIDAAGWQTTAACPEFAYVAEQDARVVAR